MTSRILLSSDYLLLCTRDGVAMLIRAVVKTWSSGVRACFEQCGPRGHADLIAYIYSRLNNITMPNIPSV